MFNDSPRCAELIVKCIAEMCVSQEGADKAKNEFNSIDGFGTSIMGKIMPAPKQNAEEAFNELVARFNIPFSLLSQ